MTSATIGKGIGTVGTKAVTDHDHAEPAVEPGADPLIALGLALRRRSPLVSKAIVDRWEQKSGFWGTPHDFEIRAQIMDTTATGTEAVARFLITGESPSAEQAEAVSKSGRAPVDDQLSLANLTKLYLCWRDAAVTAVCEEGAILHTPEAAMETALAVVRVGAESSMVGMAKQFDIAYRQLRAELDEERARLAHMAMHDPLTGLPNRALFREQLTRALLASGRRNSRIALLFVDIDHFKSVNDLAGHPAGDQLLVTVAERLSHAVRPGDTTARLGGDEFVVLCEDLHGDEAEADSVAKRVGAVLAEPVVIGGQTIAVSASIGVAVASPGDDPDVVLSQADRAMYSAKQHGRARHEFYHPAC